MTPNTDYASDIVNILGHAVAEARRIAPGGYRAGATETLDNLLYPFARHLDRTVEGLRQDVDRVAAQIDSSPGPKPETEAS